MTIRAMGLVWRNDSWANATPIMVNGTANPAMNSSDPMSIRERLPAVGLSSCSPDRPVM